MTEDYDKGTYGAEWAETYDEIFPDVAPGMIDRLFELANGGRVLELAIGTGRIALPLKERGVDISGVDISSEMVAEMRAKPGGESRFDRGQRIQVKLDLMAQLAGMELEHLWGAWEPFTSASPKHVSDYKVPGS